MGVEDDRDPVAPSAPLSQAFGPLSDEDSIKGRIGTYAACALCVFLFLAIEREGKNPSWDSLAKWGYLPSYLIWGGAYWSLLSSAFVHLALWHMLFNVYWLWRLGGAVERILGTRSWLVLVLAAAGVSSSFQLGVSGFPGHGASGIVYALFGLMWASKKEVPLFAKVLDKQTVMLFSIWLVGCIIANPLGWARIGNAAHVGGLAFGMLVAHWLILGTRRRLATDATVLFLAASMVPLCWMPWSSSWVGYKAYEAHLAGDYDAAIAGYRRSLEMGEDRVWVLGNLAGAYNSKGAAEEYAETIAELQRLSPDAAEKVMRHIDGQRGEDER